MVFRTNGKEYCGESALEIVNSLSEEAARALDKQLSVREFMLRSLSDLRDRIPVQRLNANAGLDDELMALSYLYLRDEYGAGELRDVPLRQRWAHAY
ncbi:MAG: hypothetical protein ICV60_24145 [Pyrinomonadaceae bacterium]|nr:hypothetical protein [Pyrinomonadaceae bacterium]